MAPRPINTQPPIPPTTLPTKQSSLRNLGITTPTPTPSTTIPSPTTTVPGTKTSALRGLQPSTTTAGIPQARSALREGRREALQAGVPAETVQAIAEGEQPERPGGWRGALASVINFDVLGRIPFTSIDLPGSFKPVEKTIIKPLVVLDTGRRALVSGFRESVEFAKDIKDGPQVYTARDYIPVHPQTQQPIAKIGDPVINNVDEVLSAPIPDINKIATPEQAKAATQRIVKNVGTTTGGSFSDWLKQTKDPTTGFGDIPYLQTGNIWVDRLIGFFGDVALDPTTYVGGPAAVAAGTLEAATTQGIKRAALEAAQTTAEQAARDAARIAVDAAATTAERAAAEQLARDAAVAAQKAASELKAAEKLSEQAIAQAPRRIYGANAREGLANTVRQVRDDAAETAANPALSAAERAAAQKAVNVLTDDVIAEIATKGYTVLKGDVARTLGVQSGLRIGLPGFSKVALAPKITAPLTDIAGNFISGRRLWFVNTPKGAAILSRITPTGEGGLFGSEDILRMRTALRTGAVKGEEAVDYVTMLAVDKTYRGQLEQLRKGVGQAVKEVTSTPNFQQITRRLTPYLDTPEAEWAAKGLRPLTTVEREAYNTVREFTDALYAQADQAVRDLGGPGIAKLPAYFPHVQSQNALNWAARNAKRTDKVASDLGIDATTLLSGNYLNRTLKPGSVWFGYTLKPEDIAGGVVRLNQLARQYGKLPFDFFTTNVPEALAKYADNHARFLAYAQIINSLPYEAQRIARDLRFTEPKVVTGVAAKPTLQGLTDVETRILNLMTPEKLTNWSVDQVEEVRDRLAGIATRLSDNNINKAEFNQAVLDLDEFIMEIDRGVASGAITPEVGAIMTSEAENFATALANQVENVKGQFLVTSPNRWQMVTKQLEDGFVALNAETIPDIAVRRELATIFQNVKRLDDPKFASVADTLLRDYTQFVKSYVTATPGFGIRNAIGNVFMMIAAGGNPAYLTQGIKRFQKISRLLRTAREAGAPTRFRSLDDVIRAFPESEQKIITEALAYSGATGFGQFGEIARTAGVGRQGVTGRAATGLTPFAGRRVPFTQVTIPGAEVPGLKRASEAAFFIPRKLRDASGAVEEATRFALLYDGLRRGYSPQEAANRVNKYLIDYQDLSTLDRNVKSIIPFWMWTSRNLPLQIENMWMNPRAYQLYNNARRAVEDENGESPFTPQYLKEAGAFKLLGTDLYLRPDLGFPGAGQFNPLQQAAYGDIAEVLSQLTPALRIPLELEQNTQFFSGAPIVTGNETAEEADRKVTSYILSQGIPVASVIGRYLTAIPGEEPKWVQTLTGAKLDRELQATLSLIGSPAFVLKPQQERNELWRRYFQLQEETKKRKKEK
jgi:hypothetical protein